MPPAMPLTPRMKLIHRFLDWSLTLSMLILSQAVVFAGIMSFWVSTAALCIAFIFDLTLVFVAYKEEARAAAAAHGFQIDKVHYQPSSASDSNHGSGSPPTTTSYGHGHAGKGTRALPSLCHPAVPIFSFFLAAVWATAFALLLWNMIEFWKFEPTDEQYARITAPAVESVFVAMHFALSVGTGVLCLKERKELLAEQLG